MSIFQSSSDYFSAIKDPNLDPLFRRAERRGTESAWWGHVPFAHWIVKVTSPRLLVELGTHSGVSYSAFCEETLRERLATRCFAVDTWQGDEHAGFYSEDVYREFRNFHDERYAGFSTLLRSTFDEALDKFLDSSIDLLHIDGFHTYDAVKHDFQAWLPKLSDRAVVLLHDTNERQGSFGVWKLWNELAASYPHFEFFHGWGLGVIAVGSSVPEAVRALCSLTDVEAITTIRERFSFLGERWISEMREHVLRRDLAAREDLLRKDIAAREEKVERSLAEASAHSELALSKHKEVETKLQSELETAKALLQETDSQRRSELEARTQAELEAERWRITAQQARAESTDAERRARTAALQVEEARSRALSESEQKQKIEADLQLIAAELGTARRDYKTASVNRDALLRSLSWRATAPFRFISLYTPAPIRKLAGRSTKAIWWTVTFQLGRRLQMRRELLSRARFITESGLFDPAWYTRRYPDVLAYENGPALHYVLYGAAEERDPGPRFDAKWYVQTYPDVASADVNPLIHYLTNGLAEGRQIRPPSI